MTGKKIKLTLILIVFLLYFYTNNVVQAVYVKIEDGTNVSLSEAGQYVAEFMINFYDSYADETVYVSDPKYRNDIYSGNKTKSGITIDGEVFQNRYAMDSISMVSFAYHKSLGLGGSDFEYFIQVDEKSFTVSKDFDIVLGSADSKTNLTDLEISEKIFPGDVLFTDASRKHLAIYVGSQKIIHLTSEGLTYEDISEYEHGFVAVARLKSTSASKITYANTLLVGQGSLEGKTLNGGASIPIIEQSQNNNTSIENNVVTPDIAPTEDETGDTSNKGTSSTPNASNNEYNSYRIADADDKLPLYKHILLTEKYNFNAITWTQYGHQNSGTPCEMIADKELGLKYPKDSNNTSIETFVNMVQPFLQSWYIPLSIASKSLEKHNSENQGYTGDYKGNSSISSDNSNFSSTSTQEGITRDALFPYSVIKHAYSDIMVNKYDLETLILRTSYEEYDLINYHSEFDIKLTTEVIKGEGVLSLPTYKTTVEVISNVSEVNENNTKKINTRLDKDGNINYRLENFESENRSVQSSYCLVSAKTFDLKFSYSYDYRPYSDVDAQNRVNELSSSTSENTFDEYVNLENKLAITKRKYENYTLDKFLAENNLSIVSESNPQVLEGGTISKTYRLKSNLSYSRKKGTKYYITRTWKDELTDTGNYQVSYYTIQDLIEFNTSSRSGNSYSDDGILVGEIDIRAKDGNLPYITNREELIDIFAKRNGISVVKDYSKPTMQELRLNRQKILSDTGIHSEYKLVNFRYIADAILDAQKKYGVNALLIMAATEIECNTGADPSCIYIRNDETWNWVSMEQANSMYYDMADSESLTQGKVNSFLPNNGHNWCYYTEPTYSIYDFVHYIKYKYLNNSKYNIKYCEAFCDKAWVNSVSNIIFEYCEVGNYKVTKLSDGGGKAVKIEEKGEAKEYEELINNSNSSNKESSDEKPKNTSSEDVSIVEFMKIVGQLSACYEANFNPGVIGGEGKKAFGKYQFHADYALKEFVSYAYGKDPVTFSRFKSFIGQPLATDVFRNAWTATYNESPERVKEMQDLFAYEKIYLSKVVPAFSSLTGGENLNNKSDALKAAVFSFAIRVGANTESLSPYFSGYQKGEDDKTTINRIYDTMIQFCKSGKYPGELSRYQNEKNSCYIIYNGGSITQAPTYGTSSAYATGLKESKNDYNTYKKLEEEEKLNRIDIINSNSAIYSEYLQDDDEISKYMGYSTSRLRTDYYGEIKRLITSLAEKLGELPFAYFASFGYKIRDFAPDMITLSSYSSGNGFGWPVDLTDNEGARQINCIFPATPAYFGTSHGAIDIAPGKGANYIIAAKSGTIVSVTKGYGRGSLGNRDGGGYGNNVVIDHGDGYFTRYAHLSSVENNISVGVTVAKGQRLGVMGSSGNSTGTHLDFTIYSGSTSAKDRIDPLEFYNTQPSYGSIAPSTITNLPSGYTFESEKLGGGSIENIDWNNVSATMYEGTTYEGYPVYSQDLYTNVPYNGRTVATNGCGPTSLAMILSGNNIVIPGYDTNGDKIMTPDEVARFSSAIGADNTGTGNGTKQSVLYDGLARQCGTTSSGKPVVEYTLRESSATDLYNWMSSELTKGYYNCAIISVTSYPFASGGHIIAVVGVGDKGLKTINSSLYPLLRLNANHQATESGTVRPQDKAREFTLSEFQSGGLCRATLFRFNTN